MESNGLNLTKGLCIEEYCSNGVDRARWRTRATLGVPTNDGELWLAAPTHPIDEEMLKTALKFAHECGAAYFMAKVTASAVELGKGLPKSSWQPPAEGNGDVD